MFIEGLKDRWTNKRMVLTDATSTLSFANLGLAAEGVVSNEPSHVFISVIAGPIIMILGGSAILGYDLIKRERRLQVMNQGRIAIGAWEKYNSMFPQIPTGLDSY